MCVFVGLGGGGGGGGRRFEVLNVVFELSTFCLLFISDLFMCSYTLFMNEYVRAYKSG